MTRLWLLISAMVLFGGLAAASQTDAPEPARLSADAPDEQIEREAILAKVRAAIAAKDYAGLSAIEEDLRSSRARMPSGVWKLAAFHAGLQYYLADGLQEQDGCEYREQPFVDQWIAAEPSNPAPTITDAALLLAKAWCIRGNGRADSVAADAWPRFREGVAAAAETLEQHRAAASLDPEFYAVEVAVARSQGVSNATFHDLVEDATAREPGYHRTYFNAVWYYLPQWGGSYQAVAGFARYAAQRSGSSERDGLYARIFWSLDECGCRVLERAADWPTMKRSMREVYEQYPVRWNASYFAGVSCRMKDVEEGRRYIRALHPEARDDASLAALFAGCDAQAKVGP